MYTLSDLASVLATAYGLLFIVIAALILWLVRPWRWKATGLIIVTVAFAYPLVTAQIEQKKRVARNEMIAERFKKLCREQAGDKIYRTVEGVEGFLIMRPRKPTKDLQEYLDQFWMGDPYGHSDLEAENPEYVFLSDRPAFDGASVKISPLTGYDFIELPLTLSADAVASSYLRIEARKRYVDSHGQQRIDYKKATVERPRSRYGYDWEDISSDEERKYWIAGGRMRIVDLSTQETIAERTGYVIDLEQGARAGGGIPWLVAQSNACPPFQSAHTKAKEFVAKVLKPVREKRHE